MFVITHNNEEGGLYFELHVSPVFSKRRPPHLLSNQRTSVPGCSPARGLLGTLREANMSTLPSPS